MKPPFAKIKGYVLVDREGVLAGSNEGKFIYFRLLRRNDYPHIFKLKPALLVLEDVLRPPDESAKRD